jgi:hypothetical protein
LGANAFVLAFDEVLGEVPPESRGANILFADPMQLWALLHGSGFTVVDVVTVEQTILFPLVLDYVWFQFLATPMTVLLTDNAEPERQVIISSVAAKTALLSTPATLDGGKFTFPQETYVAITRCS